jgi:hypothetical protein
LKGQPRRRRQRTDGSGVDRFLGNTKYRGRQEAALVVMRIEERELLVPINPVERVVDVGRNRRGRARPNSVGRLRSFRACLRRPDARYA